MGVGWIDDFPVRHLGVAQVREVRGRRPGEVLQRLVPRPETEGATGAAGPLFVTSNPKKEMT